MTMILMLNGRKKNYVSIFSFLYATGLSTLHVAIKILASANKHERENFPLIF